jgi:CheY-like chemotaxis protein
LDSNVAHRQLFSEFFSGLLDSLIRAQLAHFADILDRRILISGPSLKIKAAAAQCLGMILHELATNAAKYGALSVPTGHVVVDWNTPKPSGLEPEFCLSWSERGGPGAALPEKRGFGSTMLEGYAKKALKADARMDFAPSGLVWTLKCPLREIIEHSWATIETTAASVDAASRPLSGHARILIVEDETIPAMEMAAVLSEAGFNVLGPAASVREAFQCLEDTRCDAALLDINLGSETSEPIARKLSESGVPFIVISGYSREQLPSIFAGAHFLSKPLDHQRLLHELKQMSRQRN